mmetsp:Transcript_86947/g.250838  ORF Transcript_86947/g.250838 Transcript_86947/m.250838 type:complete len:302 (-) Transcript_86947:337-1242(-)
MAMSFCLPERIMRTVLDGGATLLASGDVFDDLHGVAIHVKGVISRVPFRTIHRGHGAGVVRLGARLIRHDNLLIISNCIGGFGVVGTAIYLIPVLGASDLLILATPRLLRLGPLVVDLAVIQLMVCQGPVQAVRAIDPTRCATPVLLGLRPLRHPVVARRAFIGRLVLRRGQQCATTALHFTTVRLLVAIPPRRPVLAVEAGMFPAAPTASMLAAPLFPLFIHFAICAWVLFAIETLLLAAAAMVFIAAPLLLPLRPCRLPLLIVCEAVEWRRQCRRGRGVQNAVASLLVGSVLAIPLAVA